jgi:hypothetical protein
MKTCTLPFSEGYAQQVLAPVPSHPGVLTLPKAKVVRIENADQMVTLHCVAGTVWITQTGATGDMILSAGEYRTLTGKGLILAEAINQSEAKLEIYLQGAAFEGIFKMFT